MKNELLLKKTMELIKEERLLEMSDNLSKIRKEIRDSWNQLIFHLIKYLVWSDITDVSNHWKQDIHDILYKVPKLKVNNKYPTEEQLYNWEFETAIDEVQDNIEKTVNEVGRKEELRVPKYNRQVLIDFITDYLKWLCGELGNPTNKGNVPIEFVEQELDFLYNRYYHKLLIDEEY